MCLAFALVYYFNAYVCDDAFITFRCADNLVRGQGLRWNVGERVQAFTSPLFTLVFSGFYALAYDPSDVPNPDRAYWLALLLSFGLSAATLLLLLRSCGGRPAFWAMFATLMSSQAFVTFCSSGLETPLAYLIVTIFYLEFLRPGFLTADRDYLLGFLWTGLALLTRLDLALLFLPASWYIFRKGWSRMGPRIAWVALAGLAPLAVWFFFSLCYYGFLLPNSYYAKLGLDVPGPVLVSMGLEYLSRSLTQDPITPLVCAAAAIVCWTDPRTLLAGIALVVSVLYVVCIGGDFIGFRFLAVPFLLSTIIIFNRLQAWESRLPAGWWRPVAMGALAFGILVPSSPLRAFRDLPVAEDVAFYYPASALRLWTPGSRFPFGKFLNVTGPGRCRRLRVQEPQVAVWGDGLNGFCRGPKSHLIDPHGIADALMARLALPIDGTFKPGHLAKAVPVGYPESCLTGENRILEPELAAFYEELRGIVSGPLFTHERWRNIWRMNFTAAARYREPYLGYESIPDWMREDANRDLCRDCPAEAVRLTRFHPHPR